MDLTIRISVFLLLLSVSTPVDVNAQSTSPLSPRLYDFCAKVDQSRFAGCVKAAQSVVAHIERSGWTGIVVMEEMAEWCLRDAAEATFTGGGAVPIPALASTCIAASMTAINKLRDRGVQLPPN